MDKNLNGKPLPARYRENKKTNTKFSKRIHASNRHDTEEIEVCQSSERKTLMLIRIYALERYSGAKTVQSIIRLSNSSSKKLVRAINTFWKLKRINKK